MADKSARVVLSWFGMSHTSADVGYGHPTPLARLSSILSRFGAPRSTFDWVQSLVRFGVCFLLRFVGPWIHGRGHMDTISTLDDEPSLNRHLGCLWSVFLASGMDRWRGWTLVLGSPSWVGITRPSIWSNSMNKASIVFSIECRGYGPSLVAIGHKSRSPDALGGCPTSISAQTLPSSSCNLPEGITLSSGLQIGWNKTRLHVSWWALQHGLVKMRIWWSVFTCIWPPCSYTNIVITTHGSG